MVNDVERYYIEKYAGFLNPEQKERAIFTDKGIEVDGALVLASGRIKHMVEERMKIAGAVEVQSEQIEEKVVAKTTEPVKNIRRGRPKRK